MQVQRKRLVVHPEAELLVYALDPVTQGVLEFPAVGGDRVIVVNDFLDDVAVGDIAELPDVVPLNSLACADQEPAV